LKAKDHKILYVDDEAANLTAFTYCFEDQFSVLTAQSGRTALEVLAQNRVAVLLSDQRMPDMTGAELCAVVRERHPEVVRMVVTAYADVGAAVAAINSGQVSRYLLKPWREEAMAEVLRAGIEAYELGVLVRDMQVRLLQSEQQATTTFLLGRVLHELANPAAAVQTNVHWVDDTIRELSRLAAGGAPELVELVKELSMASTDTVQAIDVLVARIDRFRQGEPSTPHPSGADLSRAVQAAVVIVQSELRKRARLHLELGEVPPVAADATQLSQILVNLLMNACEAVEPGRSEQNQILVRTRAAKGRAILDVEDTGSGIAPELLPRVFDPFVTSKGQDVARGFGLAIVRELVEKLQGEIHVSSQVQRGTRFTVEIPLADDGRL
jgi:signal transduction histidine kinase